VAPTDTATTAPRGQAGAPQVRRRIAQSTSAKSFAELKTHVMLPLGDRNVPSVASLAARYELMSSKIGLGTASAGLEFAALGNGLCPNGAEVVTGRDPLQPVAAANAQAATTARRRLQNIPLTGLRVRDWRSVHLPGSTPISYMRGRRAFVGRLRSGCTVTPGVAPEIGTFTAIFRAGLTAHTVLLRVFKET
jgi:hypothetical protein